MKLNILLSRWLSRCILRVTTEEIKLKFRQLEKCKLKNIKEKSHLVFNETCLNIYIYIYILVTLRTRRRRIKISFLCNI